MSDDARAHTADSRRAAQPGTTGGSPAPGPASATELAAATAARSAGDGVPPASVPVDLARNDCWGLLAYLRAAIDKPVPTVVIAGAGGGNGTAHIADGIALAAREGGLRLFSAELGGTPGRPVLQQRRVAALVAPERGERRLTAGGSPAVGEATPDKPRSAEPSAPAPSQAAGGNAMSSPGGVDGDSAQGGEGGARGLLAMAEGKEPATALDRPPAAGLGRWFEQASGSVDFIMVEAPALDGSADAALLARACDGLVLVVEPGVTSRDSLLRAVRIAEASGCRLLGLVMNEQRQALPDWLRRLVRGTSGRRLP